MRFTIVWVIAMVLFSAADLPAQPSSDITVHSIQFVAVEPGVKLEVLDWGGTGRPMIFLAGLGNDAHIFDTFAPKFTAHYHVYGITRRGFGASSKPAPIKGAYSSDRLGDDVLAVIDALKIKRPVLVGHSVAGEELSSIGSSHPDKVAGLIYLDAANAYAYYDRARGDLILDESDLKSRLDALENGAVENREFMGGLLTSVSQFERDLEHEMKSTASMPDPPAPLLLILRLL